jgi:hypothetical protein
MLSPTKFTRSPRRPKKLLLPLITLCAHLPESGPFSRYGYREPQVHTLLLTVLEGALL